MLIIRRRIGECLLIGDNVEIEVIDAGPGRVKLGIRAPLEVPILRKEIKLTHEQNLAASTAIAVSGEGIAQLVERLWPSQVPPLTPGNK